MGKIIGIDLGTTNSCVSFLEGGEAVVIPNQEGARTTPSIVAFTDAGDRLVGQIAKRQAVTNPQKTIYGVKRLMGRKFKDSEVQEIQTTLSYEVNQAKNGDVLINVGDRTYAPPEISSFVLDKMREVAQDFLGEEITDAVITVPAYFNDSQRQATKDAGKIAGLNVLRIINEPTAAALAYGVGKDVNETIVVYDLGGGTFDVSILEIGDNVYEVLATAGDTFLGGENFDESLIRYLVARFKESSGLDLGGDRMALQRIKEAAERAKMELSTAMETEVNLPFIAAGKDGPLHLVERITRTQFENLIRELVDKTRGPCEKALQEAGVTAAQIDEVILVGGSTRVPLVQKAVKEIFGKEPNKGVNPDEVVAAGAAIQGGILQGDVEDVLLLDVTPLSLGVETAGGVFTRIIEKNTTVPCRQTKIFSTAEDGQDMVIIHVLQGEREMADNNISLARFQLLGIPPAPRGVPQIEVEFELDSNGMLHVSAKDLGTGKAHSVKVQPTSGMTEGDIDRIIGEAAQHRDSDERKRKLVEARNELDGLMYTTQKSLAEYGGMLAPDVAGNIKLALEQAEAARDSDDADELLAVLEKLKENAYKISEAIYGDAGGGS